MLLRENLLNLTNTESRLLNMLENISNNNNGNTTAAIQKSNIKEIFELSQNLLQETFEKYFKLSSNFVSSQDDMEILRLCKMYLEHAESFLYCAIPNDFLGLKEDRNLCDMHQNLLSTQKIVFNRKNNNVNMNLIEQFNTFMVQHSEILTKIVDRYSEVEERLYHWNVYRRIQTSLIERIKVVEKEKSLLQLRYIYLKQLPQTREKVERILMKLPEIDEELLLLREELPKLLCYTDDVLSTSLRMEQAALTQRLSNLQASLETWLGFVNKIMDLYCGFDEKVKHIQYVYGEIKDSIMKLKHNSKYKNTLSEDHLELLKNHRICLYNIKKEIEEVDIMKEELKVSVSSFDAKLIHKKIWSLWQQHYDLDQEILLLIQQIEEKLSLRYNFNNRYEKLLKWIHETETDLSKRSEKYKNILTDDERLMKNLENQILDELSLKEYDKLWVTSAGNELYQIYAADEDVEQKAYIQRALMTMQEKWDSLKESCKVRTHKINEMKSTIFIIEIQISELRQWLYEIEQEIIKPIVIDGTDDAVMDRLLDDCDKIHRTIESKSSKIAEVLNLCDVLFSDVDMWNIYMDTKNLNIAVRDLDKRWQKVCANSTKKKNTTIAVWNNVQEIVKIIDSNKDWLQEEKVYLDNFEKELPNLSSDDINEKLELLDHKMNNIKLQEPIFEILNQLFKNLIKNEGVISDRINLIPSVIGILKLFNYISTKNFNLILDLKQYQTQYGEFVYQYEQILMLLTQIDAELVQVQHFSNTSESEKQNMLMDILNKFELSKTFITNCDKLGSQLITENNQLCNVNVIKQNMIEYQTLYSSIDDQLSQLNVTPVVERVDETIQVDTLGLGRDFSSQVNTLPDSGIITSKEAYIYELHTAINESRTNINNLIAILEMQNDKTVKPPSVQKITRTVAICESSVELIKHLNILLLTDYECTDAEAYSAEVNNICVSFDKYYMEWKNQQLRKDESRLVLLNYVYHISICNANTSTNPSSHLKYSYMFRPFIPEIYNFMCIS